MNFTDWKFHSFAASGYILLWIEKKLFTLVLKQKNNFTHNFDLTKGKQDPKFKTLVFCITRLTGRTYHSTITIVVIIFRINRAMKLSSTLSSVFTTPFFLFLLTIHAAWWDLTLIYGTLEMWELDQTTLTTSISYTVSWYKSWYRRDTTSR